MTLFHHNMLSRRAAFPPPLQRPPEGRAVGCEGDWGRFPFFLEQRAAFRYRTDGAVLRKEVAPMWQFLLDVVAGFLASVLSALVLRHVFRD